LSSHKPYRLGAQVEGDRPAQRRSEQSPKQAPNRRQQNGPHHRKLQREILLPLSHNALWAAKIRRARKSRLLPENLLLRNCRLRNKLHEKLAKKYSRAVLVAADIDRSVPRCAETYVRHQSKRKKSPTLS